LSPEADLGDRGPKGNRGRSYKKTSLGGGFVGKKQPMGVGEGRKETDSAAEILGKRGQKSKLFKDKRRRLMGVV